MPRSINDHYFENEDRFRELFDAFNAFSPRYQRWRYTTARKDHIDLFEEPIKDGEVYFKCQNGPAWGDVIKISRLSMERLLYVVMANNPHLEAFGKYCQEERVKELRQAHDRYAPTYGLLDSQDEQSD